jgi:hypothetical protein
MRDIKAFLTAMAIVLGIIAIPLVELWIIVYFPLWAKFVLIIVMLSASCYGMYNYFKDEQ